MGALDGYTWPFGGHWMGVCEGHWMGVHGEHWKDVHGGHWMGVHGGIGWVYMGGIGCVCMTHVGHSMGVCDGGHWMGVHWWHWMGVHWWHWMGVHWWHWMGVHWWHWMGVHWWHWMGVHWWHWMGVHWWHWMGVHWWHWMGVHGGHWMNVLHRALDGSWVYMWMNHGFSKTPAGLVSNTTSTQTTLLDYHMQEWIGHMHYTCMQDAVSWENGPGCVFSIITALVRLGSSLAPCRRVSPSMHPESNLAKIHLYQCIDK